MKPFYSILIAYFVIISTAAVIIICYDKRCAIRGKWRVKESTLLVISAFGGGIAMYVTMLLVRHKTKKLKFMLGIPLMVIAEVMIIMSVVFYGA